MDNFPTVVILLVSADDKHCHKDNLDKWLLHASFFLDDGVVPTNMTNNDYLKQLAVRNQNICINGKMYHNSGTIGIWHRGIGTMRRQAFSRKPIAISQVITTWTQLQPNGTVDHAM